MPLTLVIDIMEVKNAMIDSKPIRISFIRHGESRSNARQVLASGADEHNGLTAKGIVQIQEAASALPSKVNGVFSSPYLRTIVSAQTFIDARSEKLELTIDDRLREIDYGKHVDQKDHPDMEHVATQQIGGNYEIRFGETGENKREILARFYSFLADILSKYPAGNHIVVFSHGRAISMLEASIAQLKNITKKRVHTGNGTIKELLLQKEDAALLEKYLKEVVLRVQGSNQIG